MALTFDQTPEETAADLKARNFPVEQYEEIQERRNYRLQFWKEKGIQALIDKEQELVNFGEKVLSLLRA